MRTCYRNVIGQSQDDVSKWKHFPPYWPFVRGIHRSPINSPHKGQWRRALMFSFICDWINGCVNNREAGDLRRNNAHYDVMVMTNLSPKPRIKMFEQIVLLFRDSLRTILIQAISNYRSNNHDVLLCDSQMPWCMYWVAPIMWVNAIIRTKRCVAQGCDNSSALATELP